MKKVLILSGISWNSTYQRHQKIANYFGKKNCEVYFIEDIISSKITILKILNFLFYKFKNICQIKKENQKNKNVRLIKKKFINPQGMLNYYNYIVVKKILLEIGNSFDIVINYLPIETTRYILKNINYKILVYDCVRDFQNWGGYPNNLVKIEQNLIKNSNFILVDSFYLYKKMSELKLGKKVLQILPTLTLNEYSFYKKYKKEVIQIKKLTYFGTIDSRSLDLDILNKLARYFEINLIGKIEGRINLNKNIKIREYISNLEELAIKVMEISDAIILPYSEKMDGVIPAKTVQTLATGLPVFIKEFYDSKKLNEYWYTYKNFDELLEKITLFNKEEFKERKYKIEKFILQNIEEITFEKIDKLLEEEVKK